MEKLNKFYSIFPLQQEKLNKKYSIFPLTKKPEKMKKTFCFNNCACYSPRKNQSTRNLNFQSYLSRKKGTSETFLSLGLFISRSRPTASTSKIRPRLRKTFPQFPFFYFGNLGKTQITRGQIFPQTSKHNYRNKLLFHSKNQFWTKRLVF